MFQFPTSPSCTLWIHVQVTELLSLPGFPIRKSVLLRLFAPSHSLSQLVTSFFGSWCQGIHPTLLVAWPFLILQSCFIQNFRFFKNLSPSKIELLIFQSVILKTILTFHDVLPFSHAFNGCAFYVFSFFHKIIYRYLVFKVHIVSNFVRAFGSFFETSL